MIYQNPNREIVVGVRREVEMPRDTAFVTQVVPGKPTITIVHSYQTYNVPKERDDLMKALGDYEKLMYVQDVVAYVPNEKHIEDSLIHFLLDMRNNLWQNGESMQAEKITQKLRSMGIVIKDRKDSHFFWNLNGEMRRD